MNASSFPQYTFKDCAPGVDALPTPGLCADPSVLAVTEDELEGADGHAEAEAAEEQEEEEPQRRRLSSAAEEPVEHLNFRPRISTLLQHKVLSLFSYHVVLRDNQCYKTCAIS